MVRTFPRALGRQTVCSPSIEHRAAKEFAERVVRHREAAKQGHRSDESRRRAGAVKKPGGGSDYGAATPKGAVSTQREGSA